MVTFLIIKKEQLVAALFFLNDWIVLHITCITIVWKSWSMFYGFKRIRDTGYRILFSWLSFYIEGY
ncbi:hypothetical protein A4U60_05350 [Priestia endophytica]|nr:hypothetical protein A4U60_05350 [Priestia endophytica]